MKQGGLNIFHNQFRQIQPNKHVVQVQVCDPMEQPESEVPIKSQSSGIPIPSKQNGKPVAPETQWLPIVLPQLKPMVPEQLLP